MGSDSTAVSPEPQRTREEAVPDQRCVGGGGRVGQWALGLFLPSLLCFLHFQERKDGAYSFFGLTLWFLGVLMLSGKLQVSDAPPPVSQALSGSRCYSDGPPDPQASPRVSLRFWAHPWDLPRVQVPGGGAASLLLPPARCNCSFLAAHISGPSAPLPLAAFPGTGDTCKVTLNSADSAGAGREQPCR